MSVENLNAQSEISAAVVSCYTRGCYCWSGRTVQCMVILHYV